MENKKELIVGVGYQDIDKVLVDLIDSEAPRLYASESSGIPKRTIDKWARRHFDGRTWSEEVHKRQDKRTREEHGLSTYHQCSTDFDESLKQGFSPFIRKDESEKVKHEIKETGFFPTVGKEVVLKGLKATENDGLHRYECNIPYLPFNPVKRISLAARAITTAGEWKNPEEPLFTISPESNWENLSNGAIYHDVSTINATIAYAKTEDDRRLTIDDAIIISKKFADKLEYDYINTDKASGRFVQWAELFVDKNNKPIPLVDGEYIEAGDPLQWIFYNEEETEIYFIEGNVAPVSGFIEIVGEPKFYGKKDKKWVQGYRIRVKGKIGVGDKLLGLTGLRGVICEVRDNLKADIMIHSAKVWGTKGSRKCGSMYKEIKETGHVAVFFQPAHLAKNEISLREVTISTTLWSVLAIYGNVQLASQRFADICYMFRMEIDDKGFLRSVDKKVEDRKDGIVLDARVAFFNNQKPDNLWMPDWLQLEYLKSTSLGVVTKSTAVKNELKQTLKMYDPLKGNIKAEYYLQNAIVTSIKSKKLFETEIKNSTYNVVCIPFLQPISKKKQSNVVYLNSSMGYEDGQRVLIVREPVISKTNVQHVRIIHDETLPHNVIKIDPYTIKQMYGDFDGDRVWILPIDDEAFKEKVEDYRFLNDSEELNLDIDVQAVEKCLNEISTYETKIKEAKIYHDSLIESKVVGAGKFGGARKNCDLKVNIIKNTKEFTLPNAYLLELGIKDRDQNGKKHDYTIAEYQKECAKRIKAVDWKDSLIVQLYNIKWNNIRWLVDKRCIYPDGLYNEFYEMVDRCS